MGLGDDPSKRGPGGNGDQAGKRPSPAALLVARFGLWFAGWLPIASYVLLGGVVLYFALYHSIGSQVATSIGDVSKEAAQWRAGVNLSDWAYLLYGGLVICSGSPLMAGVGAGVGCLHALGAWRAGKSAAAESAAAENGQRPA